MSMRSTFEEMLSRELTPGEVDYLRDMIRQESPIFSANLKVEGRRLIVDLRHPFGNWGPRARANWFLELWTSKLQHRLHEFLSADVVKETFTLLRGFKYFVERQGRRDVWIDGFPREQVARGLLQAYLDARSYREVPVGNGQSDLLIFTRHGSLVVIETKIWRGQKSFSMGLTQLRTYIASENDDRAIAAAFYLIFDPTRRHQATRHIGDPVLVESDHGPITYSLAINIDRVLPSVQD